METTIHWTRPREGWSAWGPLRWAPAERDAADLDAVALDAVALDAVALDAVALNAVALNAATPGPERIDPTSDARCTAPGPSAGAAALPPGCGPDPLAAREAEGVTSAWTPLAGLDDLEPPVEDLWSSRPLGEWARGPRIAIVGSRAPTPYGLEQAERFAAGLVSAGWSIWSGLARGIDAAAHLGALDAGGHTVALLGSSLDRAWPPGTALDRVSREGVLLSEHPPGTGPRRHHFPLRNRILAAAVDAVLVVEAAWASGSLITARWAADLGRPVFALPGRIDSPFGMGVLRLLREGATPVGSPGDLLAQLEDGVLTPRGGPAEGPEGRTRDPVLDALIGDTAGASTLAERLGWELSRVLARLAELELDDRVQRLPGGLWCTASRSRPQTPEASASRRTARGPAP